MEIPDLLQELYGRNAPRAREAAQYLDADAFHHRPTPDSHHIGFGHSPEHVAGVRVDDVGALLDYLAAVDARTQEYLGRLSASDLDRIVDTSWDPPVRLGPRLVSVAEDCLQHAGQANYLRGTLGRRGEY